MDVSAAFSSHPAPWGPIHFAVSDAGVVGLEVLALPEAFVTRVAQRAGGSIVAAEDAGRMLRGRLEQVHDQLEDYLNGTRRSFELPVDLRTRSDWDRQVLDGVRRIPFGTTASYGGVARAIGRTGAARAVGGAVGRNPIGILIPCHRIIAGDGTLGGYGGDWYGTREQMLSIKRMLLKLEGVEQPPAPGRSA